VSDSRHTCVHVYPQALEQLEMTDFVGCIAQVEVATSDRTGVYVCVCVCGCVCV
jgi:hypothetical protein